MKPDGPIQWTLNAAQQEFGIHRDTIKTRLTQQGAVPDTQGFYTTKQLTSAIFNDLTAERTGLTRAQREHWELENKQAAGILINVDDAIAAVHQFTYAIRGKILLSTMTETEKNGLLLELQRIGEMDFNKIGEDDAEDTKVAG